MPSVIDKAVEMRFEQVSQDPAIFAIRIPLAHFGLSSTNCYVICDEEDALVIDPGIRAVTSRKVLEHACKQLAVNLSDARFLLTHLHFDHAGVIEKLTGPGSEILMSRYAYEFGPRGNNKEHDALVKQFMSDEGIFKVSSKAMAVLVSESRVCELEKRRYTLLEDGQEIRVGKHAFQVIETPGHTRGDICLYHAQSGILISGDHVLKRTTPGLALPIGGYDSLSTYLSSLDALSGLDVRLVLPGHGDSFEDLESAICKIRKNHEKRLLKTYEIIAEQPGKCGRDITRSMRWAGKRTAWERLSVHMRLTFSKATLAYIECLVHMGEVGRKRDGLKNRYYIA